MSKKQILSSLDQLVQNTSRRLGHLKIPLFLGVLGLASAGGVNVDVQTAQAATSVIDRDSDNIDDNLEVWIAQQYSPMLRFDEGESFAPTIRILWQVHPLGCIGQDCSSPMRVAVTYVMLYQMDGGRSGIMGHCGDNERVSLHIDLSNNTTNISTRFVKAYYNHHTTGTWHTSLEWKNGRPVVYVSEDKHASYSTKQECEQSSPVTESLPFYIPISPLDEDCDEGHWFSTVVSSSDNVGEVNHQLVGNLGGVFSGEHAWDRNDFCGGYTSSSCGNSCASSNYSKWKTSSFTERGSPLTKSGRQSSSGTPRRQSSSATSGRQNRQGISCINNDTDITINYSYRWGDGEWKKTSVRPGRV